MVSRGINKVILIGNLGQDPDVRYMSNGGIVTSITLATTESWKDKQSGEIRERTEWHRVVLFGKLAEIASEYLHKGAQIYIEGSLQTRKWQDQNGQERYTTEVIVGRFGGVMQMLGVRKREGNVKSKIDSETEEDVIHNILKDSRVENISSGSDKLDINFDQDIPF